ncbi:MAG: IS1182 family transposase [Nevskiales bacterium]
MARYKPRDRHLLKLLPVSFDAQILPGSFEYALSWLIDYEIDLSVFEARFANDDGGAPAYDPGVLLKIVLYAYSRGLVSSRSIERACRDNVVFMALSGDTQPHFTTIANFVATLSGEITQIFRDVLLVCDEQGLIGKQMFAVDGCKLPSNASKEWSGTRADFQRKAGKMERAVEYLVAQHRAQDVGQRGDEIIEREQRQIETLKQASGKLRAWLDAHAQDRKGISGKPVQSNLTDPDSAKMKSAHGVIQGYTGVTAVDHRHQVVVHAEAFGVGQENALLPEVLDATADHFKALGKPKALKATAITADAGYHSEATLRQLADRDIDGYVADTNFRKRDPRFAERDQHKPEEKRREPGERRSKWYQAKDFEFDPKTPSCKCPAGQSLRLSTQHAVIKGLKAVTFEGTRETCGNCPLRVKCLRKPDLSPYRQVAFFQGRAHHSHPHTARMKQKIDSPRGRAIYSRRLGTVEPVFAHLRMRGLQRFTLRTRRKVDTQWKLYCLVHNIQKIRRYGNVGAA